MKMKVTGNNGFLVNDPDESDAAPADVHVSIYDNRTSKPWNGKKYISKFRLKSSLIHNRATSNLSSYFVWAVLGFKPG